MSLYRYTKISQSDILMITIRFLTLYEYGTKKNTFIRNSKIVMLWFFPEDLHIDYKFSTFGYKKIFTTESPWK